MRRESDTQVVDERESDTHVADERRMIEFQRKQMK